MIIPSIFKSVGSIAAGAVGVISAPLVAAIPSAAIGAACLASSVCATGIVGATLSAKSGEKEEKTYTTEEVSKILGISEYTVRKKIRFGKLKAKNIIGKKGYVITNSDLQDYLHPNKKNTEEVVSLQTVQSSALDFDTKVELLTKEILGQPEAKPELIREFIAGKEIELEGLNLRLKRFELEDDRNSVDFEKMKTELLIEINELKSTIQAYKVVLARVQEDTKTKKG